MLNKSSYDDREFYAPSAGMNQNISDQALPPKFCYYLLNMLPDPLGEARVRYGTSQKFSQNDFNYSNIQSFLYRTNTGGRQIIRYGQVFKPLSNSLNLNIPNANHIILTNTNFDVFEKDTYLSLQYRTPDGLSSVSYNLIKDIEEIEENTVSITLFANSFPDDLEDFFVAQETEEITYISDHSISFSIVEGFNPDYFYSDLQEVKLTVNDVDHILTISVNGIEVAPGTVTLIFNEFTVPVFEGTDEVSLAYESNTPELVFVNYASGILDVYDFATNSILDGPTQKIENLSVACVPRGEFINKKYLICNGVDKNMIWDGTTLHVYKEFVKEYADSFNRINDTNFSFQSNAAFLIEKYVDGEKINLKVDNASNILTISDIEATANQDGFLVTITTVETIPAFTGVNRLEVFYSDSPPPFSYVKSAHNRIYALGPGAVSLEYRNSIDALRFFYSYTTSVDDNGFRFFNEETKTVPSFDISDNHGIVDNLEAITLISDHLAFIGRQATQVWVGSDPNNLQSPNALTHLSTLPVGIFHGDLLNELPNDTYFITDNGCLSFSTLNAAKQFAANSFSANDPLIRKHIKSIGNSNFAYRACRSFKYSHGAFCGFKIGFNDVLVSKYDTKLYAWSIFSGDFETATSYVADSKSLFLLKKDEIFQYADGNDGNATYGDNDGKNLILYAVTWPVKSKRIWSNKRYEIQVDYSSSVVVNTKNYMNIVVNGDLTKTFRLEGLYKLDFVGDLLGSIPLASGDNINSETLGFRFGVPSGTINDRLQFKASNFYLTIIGQTMDGPLSLKMVTLYGIGER